MEIEVDQKSGFCFGVQNAVEIAEKALLNGEQVFSLGPIVHNDMEMERLTALGLEPLNHEQFGHLKNCNVLIRAHGEPPSTYRIAAENNIRIIEATCPIVKKLQSRIKDTWLTSKDNGDQIVIFGKPGHAEVVGLLGQTNNEGILISGPGDIMKIDFKRRVHLFSQTTMGVREYNHLKELIIEGMRKAGIDDPENRLFVRNSICGQVSNREPHLIEFAGKHDVIIFVSGSESSNGRMLFNVCKNVNSDTYFVSSPDDIDPLWFKGKKSAGICGATSTPKWLIEKIRDFISNI